MALLTRTGLRINRYCSMADFRFLMMAAVRHLRFSKVPNFNFRPNRRLTMRHHTKFREDGSNRCGDIADFRFFKMAAAAILDFGNFKFLTVETLMSVELSVRAKFWRNRSNSGWDMAIFHYFKMAAVRHLGFSKVGNFNFRSHSEAQYASSCQITWRSVEPFRRYCRFSIVQDGGRRHLGFSKF